ncbi:porin [Pelomonas sp. KK5]|uniref:porin n=1 Tax=Pelomonas sp. KK5 TaxID=1855730 RepID=UPI00097C1DBF|nr:porin [Pelomonas sp. KK5]
MNKTLMAATLAALPLAASAQSVSLYGILDVSVQAMRFGAAGAHPSTHLTALTSDTSRVGLRGSEDLGGGLRAYFKIEHGLQADNGTQTSATAFWNRESYVGLSDATLGAVQLGSQFTQGLWLSLKTDPFMRFGVGGQYTLLQGLRGYQNRFDNTVQLITPNLSGVQGRLLVSAGEGAVTGASYSGSLDYTQGPLMIGAVLDQVKATAASLGLKGDPRTSRTLSLAGTYDLKVAKLAGWLQSNRVDSLPNVSGYMLAATVPVGPTGEIRASFAHRSTGSANADASLAAIGYAWLASKRTQLYATVARLDNKGGNAAFRMGPATAEQAAAGLPFAGQDTSGLQLGIRHYF